MAHMYSLITSVLLFRIITCLSMLISCSKESKSFHFSALSHFCTQLYLRLCWNHWSRIQVKWASRHPRGTDHTSLVHLYSTTCNPCLLYVLPKKSFFFILHAKILFQLQVFFPPTQLFHITSNPVITLLSASLLMDGIAKSITKLNTHTHTVA